VRRRRAALRRHFGPPLTCEGWYNFSAYRKQRRLKPLRIEGHAAETGQFNMGNYRGQVKAHEGLGFFVNVSCIAIGSLRPAVCGYLMCRWNLFRTIFGIGIALIFPSRP